MQLYNYSVIQSNGISFGGGIILDTFNMVHSDEKSISEQKYEKRIFWDLYYEVFRF